MKKKHFIGILTITAICLSGLTLGNYYFSTYNSNEAKPSNLKVHFTPGGNITFSNLHNTTNFKIKGSYPATYYPNEFYQVEITIIFPVFNQWTNSTTSLLKISNHDIIDKNVYFEGSGGSKFIQWIFMNFTQYETDKNASIIWNTRGNINYYGDWLVKDGTVSLLIPGRVGNKIFSIDFYSLAIAFDQGVTKKQMEDTNWEMNIYSLKSGNANGFAFMPMIIGLSVILCIKHRKRQKLT